MHSRDPKTQRPRYASLITLAIGLLATACSDSSAPVEPPPAIPTPTLSAPDVGPGDQPNVVFILLDDMRALDLELGFGRSIEGWDSALVSRFVEGGTTFENYFNTTPLCCPSRVSYLTGRYAHNHSVYANGYDSSDGNGGWRRWWEQGYEGENVGSWMQQAGYTTALVGKFLNGYPNDPGFFLPETHVPPGWDEFYSTHIETSVFSYYDFVMTENGELVSYGPEQDAYLTDVERDHAVDFIRSAAGTDEPYFLYLNAYSPHAPSEAAPRHQGMHDHVRVEAPPSFNEADLSDKPAHIRDGATERVNFFGGGARRRLDMTLAVDELIAAVFGELEATGQLDNTYVFLASDNGITVGEHSTGGKSTPYEEAIRVPMLVAGPGVVAGATYEHLVANIDIAPTLLDLAGATAPNWVDGESLLDLLAGGSGQGWRDGILIELRHPVDSPNQSGIIPRYFGVRTADYLFAEYETGERELYDLAADPWQIDSIHDTAGQEIIGPLKNLIDGMRGCSGEGCRLGSRLALDSQPPMNHRCEFAECEFDGDGVDGRGEVAAYRWDFGDGDTAEGQLVAHVYDTPGFHTVRLSIEFADGTTSANTRHIRVAIPRPIAFVSNVIMDDQSEKGVVTAKITIADGAIELVEGAEVEARWRVNGAEQGAVLKATSNAAGKAFYSLKDTLPGDTYELCIVTLQADGLIYDPAANIQDCGTVTIQ